MTNTEIILIAHNLRSCQNVGSLLRTADGLAVKKVYLTGYTPYPITNNDTRLPYLREKISKRISKTSLGAEEYIDWQYSEDINQVLDDLHNKEYKLIALEQTKDSVELDKFISPKKIAIVVGREVEGIEEDILKMMDGTIEIPMLGKKESFNVTLAAAMTIYKMRYFD
jgi:tRNA G18 (ribose-2'-O)-methylase SpoU